MIIMKTIWGIDLGGTKAEGVVLDEHFQTIARKRVPTEKEHGYEHIIRQIAKLVDMLAEEVGHRPDRLGIGTPGVLDPKSETLKNSNTVCMNGMPVKKDLEAALGLSVVMANDANCFALAEAKMGIVQDEMPDAEVVFGVIMGTGVGGCLVIDNKIIGGRHGIGGEWGHVFLDEGGGMCYCGKIGCVETLISGPHIEKYYTSLTGETIIMKEIMERYEAGNDAAAQQTIERLLEMFGKGMSLITNIIDPDCIVIGGGLGNIDLLYSEGVERVKKYLFNNSLETKFLKPKLGDSAGVFGAAMLVA
jgi:fructokinase